MTDTNKDGADGVVSTNWLAVLKTLRERYRSPDEPRCRVCGGKMEIGMIGQGRIEWHCASDEANGIAHKFGTPEERKASQHWHSSEYIQTRFGDCDVLAVCDELERMLSANDKAQP